MRTAYFLCKSGIAGDMILASLIDSGIQARSFERSLEKCLRVSGWRLAVTPTARHHFPAKLVTVKGDRHFESPYRIQAIIKKSTLPETPKRNSLAILDALIKAESRVHGVPEDRVHFHELNSIDTLIDITGSCLALHLAGIEQVYASPLNIGRPAPATLEIIEAKKVPVFSTDHQHELVTPTGAAIISTMAAGFGPMPCMVIEKTGFGAGSAEFETHPNLLNVLIGSIEVPAREYEHDEIILLETNIDDMDPRIYPYVMEKLLGAGVNDVWLTQVLMKKGRPGIVLSVLCPHSLENDAVTILFEETTTLGIRRFPAQRHLLKRTLHPGTKTAYLKNNKTKTKAEFRTARHQALKTSKPLRSILY